MTNNETLLKQLEDLFHNHFSPLFPECKEYSNECPVCKGLAIIEELQEQECDVQIEIAASTGAFDDFFRERSLGDGGRHNDQQ